MRRSCKYQSSVYSGRMRSSATRSLFPWEPKTGLAYSPQQRKSSHLKTHSATVVAYGAIIRAVTRVMSSRKSHYWIGIARQDEYSKRSHIDAPTDDVITDISPIGRYDKMQNRKFVKVIHWLAMPVSALET
jgi:hypothetical protein